MIWSAFELHGRYRERWSGSLLILAPGPIPTVDYYLTSRLGGMPGIAACSLDSRRFVDAPPLPTGTFVVIARHASPVWLRFLLAHSEHLSSVAYLMDDDIPIAWQCRDVPLDYALWTSGRFLRIRRLLARLCDRLWVSTPELARRYPGAKIVPPRPFERPPAPAPVGCRRWAYHGTRIHQREPRWLLPVVEAVQRAVPEAEFEVFGGQKVKRLFAHVPRVVVHPPLPWPDYVAHCRARPLAVGVAPLLPGRFNAARSHTKVFDILRCGAAGVFSAREPYTHALGDNVALCLPDERSAWVDAIIGLLTDDAWRMTCFHRLAGWSAAQAAADSDLNGLLA